MLPQFYSCGETSSLCPLFSFLLPSDRLVFSLYLSSLFFLSSKTNYLFLYLENMLFLSVPKTEGLVLIWAQWDHWGEAPRQNNIMTHKRGYVWSRSGDRRSLFMWVNLGFHFPGALWFGPGMTGRPDSVQKVRFSTKICAMENHFQYKKIRQWNVVHLQE